MMYNRLCDNFHNELQDIHLQQLLQSNTITSTIIHNRFDNQLQWHCKRIIGTVHNGLSTEADGLLTKVQATGES
jgi:hypothetical protein